MTAPVTSGSSNVTVYANRQPPVIVPSWVRDLSAFRRWARSSEFPEQGNVTWLAGRILVDVGMERFAHNKLKADFTTVLTLLVEENQLGHFLIDRMRLTNLVANLSAEPDAMFVSEEALEQGRVLISEGANELEIEGSPDMVLEIVSPGSVEKDTELLMASYWQAGIEEYWLVEETDGDWRLTLFRRGAKGYVAVRQKEGWSKSLVFGKSFRLTRSNDNRDLPHFRLEMR